jgi:hypothetical protein
MKLTPIEWCAKLGYRIADPDGWRTRAAPSWDTPIDEAEFLGRMGVSTCMFDGAKQT